MFDLQERRCHFVYLPIWPRDGLQLEIIWRTQSRSHGLHPNPKRHQIDRANSHHRELIGKCFEIFEPFSPTRNVGTVAAGKFLQSIANRPRRAFGTRIIESGEAQQNTSFGQRKEILNRASSTFENERNPEWHSIFQRMANAGPSHAVCGGRTRARLAKRGHTATPKPAIMERRAISGNQGPQPP